MDISFKIAFSGLAIVLTFVAFVPYIKSTISGTTKPHVFSWIIWGTTTGIVFFAQLEAKGGIGAWPIGVSGAITVLVALLAFIKSSDVSITRTDWVFFLAALTSLPFWYFTSDPLWAVVVLTTVDLLGFGPTIRKAYDFPHDENVPFFLLFMARNTFALLALEHYSIATVLFPLSVSIACLLLLVMVSYRRRVVQV
ncbi:conserved hypothetical protein [Vibrio nigripulchritudo SFn27]|uniref:Uncharacterized protein n=1 Tax=Vibrio nigripulchritudo TaxID=28173 RepID=U4KGK3_9VIBR|nr:hypothetical protein [Vibrio nigripulchritudo]CCN80877.1 conserved hypothetical protein [Vibrio nigripulchritudo BLFn1]CCN88006.1 conserved hypothetical protein [Vibrio nigripulchritudo SFn27]CCN96861.1 conserved hypothetical protein [Vibrio nigripulchritudo ENn2]CCO43486.1 conserved hypothetical protein [Vibrio nigripulchritudo SFn135]CCO51609.1 conserved hypothetical protein [Vibrio nigripulchritudo Wn13]